MTAPAHTASVPRRSSFRLGTAALYVFLTLYCLCNLFPFLWALLSSTKTNTEIYAEVLALPKTWSFDNYFNALETGGLAQGMLNSVLITVPTLLIVLSAGSMAAWVLARVMPIKWIYNYFVIGVIIPVQVILIPTFIIIKTLGLTNSLLALILLYSAMSLPLAVFILTGFMRSLPRELEEAALIDGAGPVTVFLRVVLPLSRPGLAVVATLTFLFCWNEYLLALVMNSAPFAKTLPQGVGLLRGQYVSDFGLQTAGIVIAVLPVIVVYILFQEQFIKGATAGATKG